jgi:sugar (pentulose or hexulose) kinase
MSDLLISIDLGTTRLKVSAFSLDGTLHEQRFQRHREHDDGSGRWQDPDQWWQDTVALVGEVRTALERRLGSIEVLGLSLSGRGGAAIFADAWGEVLVPPWSDNRQREERARLDRAYPGGLAPYTAAMLAKCLWLRMNAPELFLRVRYAFYAKDFLLYRLTGTHRTDWSSGPDGPQWPIAVLSDLDLPEALLPQPALPWEIAGNLSPRAAQVLGLPDHTPVAVGAHDGICANVGAGASRPGDYAVTLGTNAVVRAVTERVSPGAYRFYCLPMARHVVGGNALMGGRAADWFLDLSGAGGADRDRAFAQLESVARAVPAGADGARFLPYLGGQVSPERRTAARGVLAGLNIHHGAAAGYRAVLEGVAFAVAAIFHQVNGWCGEPNRIRLTGGGAQSALWTEILAAVLGRSLELTDTAAEGRGAAIFLALGLGLHEHYDAAADAMVRLTRRVDPAPELVGAYQQIQADWGRLNNIVRNYEQ